MKVWDKAKNRLHADFTEIIRFEVLHPDSGVVIYNPVQAIPQTLEFVDCNNQQGPAGTDLNMPFVVSVLDQNGLAYVGATVTFAITSGDGTLSTETAITDHNGQTTTLLTLETPSGTYTVEARVSGLEPVIFSAIGQAVLRTLTIVSGENQQGPAGFALAYPFVVSVLDQSGSPYAGATVSFDITGGVGDLSGADLKDAYLVGTDLRSASFARANLQKAKLARQVRRTLYSSKLTGVDLRGADLTKADLSGSELTGADLTGAYLEGAKLTGAILEDG